MAFAARALDEIHRVLTPGGLFVHETRLSQLLSHPIRSLGRSMPLHVAPQHFFNSSKKFSTTINSRLRAQFVEP